MDGLGALLVAATLLRVLDGDTVEVEAYPWPGFTVQTMVRVAGANAPETYRPECAAEREAGLKATEFVKSLEGPVQLYNVRKGSFAGRVVAQLYIGPTDVGTALLDRGLAVPYGVEGKWCDEPDQRN